VGEESMTPDRIILIICVIVFTLTAAVCDWRTKKLPNVLTVTAFVCALLFHLVYGLTQDGLRGAGQQLVFALAGFGTGFGILLVMWLMGSGGGGDVKYMGALGAWLGAMLTFQVFIVSALLVVVGAMMVFSWEFIGKGLIRTRARYIEHGEQRTPSSEEAAKARRTRRRILPFGVPAALATWLVLFVSEFIR